MDLNVWYANQPKEVRLEDLHYDYQHQAWVKDGKYQRCGHPESMNCNCYGRTHAGETAQQ